MFKEILEMKLTELIDGMAIDEQYDLFKEYCYNNNCYDEEPIINDEFTINEYFYNLTPYEVLERFEGWDSSWDYFVDGIYGLKEWKGIEYTSDVVNFIMSSWNDLENAEIEDLLEIYEEDLDEFLDRIYEENEPKDADEFLKMTEKELNEKGIESSKILDYYEEIEEIISYYFE